MFKILMRSYNHFLFEISNNSKHTTNKYTNFSFSRIKFNTACQINNFENYLLKNFNCNKNAKKT